MKFAWWWPRNCNEFDTPDVGVHTLSFTHFRARFPFEGSRRESIPRTRKTCYIRRNQHIFRKYSIFSLMAKSVLHPGEMASLVRFVPLVVVWRTLI